MEIVTQKDRLMFMGTVKELRAFLRTLPAHLTLREFIRSRLH